MKPYEAVGVFCDDIREEVGGKITLIGIYSDNVNVTSIPGAFVQLSVYVRVHINLNFDAKEVILLMRLADGEEIQVGDFDPRIIKAQRAQQDTSNPSPYVGLVMQAQFIQLAIKQTGRMLAVVRINGEETIATSLNVKLAPKKQ
jgi:hypothetical protein